MRIGSEFLTSNTQIAYPFLEGAEGLARSSSPVYGTAATIPVNIFADAEIMVPAFAEPDTNGLTFPQLFLKSISTADGEVFDFVFVDSYGNTVLSGTINISEFNNSSYYHTVQFNTGDYSGVFVFVSEEAATYLSGMSIGVDSIFDYRLQFESRVVSPKPKRIQSFSIDGGPEVNADVTFKGGCNIDLSQSSDEDQDTTGVTLSAVPGSGTGRYRTDCYDMRPLTVRRSFMGAVPDEYGDIRLVGDPCYNIIPFGGDSFQIQGVCYACCSCDDYVDTLKALKVLLDRAAAIRLELINAHSKYDTGVNGWNTELAPKYTQPYLQVNGMAGDGETRNSKLATLVITVKNNSPQSISIDSSIDIYISGVSTGASIVTAHWVYDSQSGIADCYSSNQAESGVPNPDPYPVIKPGTTISVHVLMETEFRYAGNPTWEFGVTVYVRNTDNELITLFKNLNFT